MVAVTLLTWLQEEYERKFEKTAMERINTNAKVAERDKDKDRARDSSGDTGRDSNRDRTEYVPWLLWKEVASLDFIVRAVYPVVCMTDVSVS